MKKYVEELGLRFDPFEPSASKRDFYGGGWRQELCNQIVESAMYAENIIAVYGELGSGKSVLAQEIARSFDDEAVTVLVHATLFMNSEQFVEALADQLNLSETESGKDQIIEEVAELAQQLDLEAKSLLIQIDDAHELSREVLQDLLQIKAACPPSSIHIILFGETQLANMLQSILTVEQGSGLVEMDIPNFASDATIDYVRFKLERAGFSKSLPISGASLGSIHNASNGIPGAINALASEILEREYGHTHVEAAIGSIANLEKEYHTGDSDEVVDEFDDDLGPPNRRYEQESDSEKRAPAFYYMVAASVLVVAFLVVVLFFQPSAPEESVAVSIPVPAVAPAEVPAPAPDSAEPLQLANSPLAATSRPAEPTASAQPSGQIVRSSEPPAAMPVREVGVEVPTSSVASKPVDVDVSKPPALIEKPIPAPKQAAPAPVRNEPIKPTASSLSSYEQTLLSRSANNYVLQILGASSESSVSKFIAKEKLDLETGYFETRLNGKPWFVVLVGNFTSRSAATAAMEALPASAKAYGPWVRSVSDIQTAIRAQQANN